MKKIPESLLNMTYSDSVYAPAEDSFLLADSISEHIKKTQSMLEIGCGTGYVCLQLAKKAKTVTAVDINPDAILLTKTNAEKNNLKNITVFKSDLFSKIKADEKFDVVVFNPPYLPDDGVNSKDMLDKALIGGATGREVLSVFLKGVKTHLTENGRVFFLISSFTGQREVEEKLIQEGFFFKVIGSKKLFFETLYVYLAT
ncbi:MAG: methyltransferase, partial [Candidatus Diapherotrites archaeon]|nr:methyltransferase [Candidatus Diapherotrites archaeon]